MWAAARCWSRLRSPCELQWVLRAKRDCMKTRGVPGRICNRISRNYHTVMLRLHTRLIRKEGRCILTWEDLQTFSVADICHMIWQSGVQASFCLDWWETVVIDFFLTLIGCESIKCSSSGFWDWQFQWQHGCRSLWFATNSHQWQLINVAIMQVSHSQCKTQMYLIYAKLMYINYSWDCFQYSTSYWMHKQAAFCSVNRQCASNNPLPWFHNLLIRQFWPPENNCLSQSDL